MNTIICWRKSSGVRVNDRQVRDLGFLASVQAQLEPLMTVFIRCYLETPFWRSVVEIELGGNFVTCVAFQRTIAVRPLYDDRSNVGLFVR
jgi:hypothetical protein